MIRFRFTEDERRYSRLRAEVYRIVALHIPAEHLFKAMRNFGKLEELAHFEGIRQGFAGAEMALLMDGTAMPQARTLKAFQAHAAIYGSTDTPLVQVEDEILDSLNQTENAAYSSWLDREPMRFAPQTLAEWAAEETAGVAVREPGPGEEPSLIDRFDRLKTAGEVPVVEGDLPDGDDKPFDTDDWRALQQRAKKEPEGETEEAEQPPDSPQFLDRVREHLLGASEKYESWQDLIFKLHIGLQADAGYLDIILSTPEGLTVLAQCNQTHLHPGAEMNLQAIQKREP